MLKVFTGFAGYGGDKFALQLANIDYEEVGFSEIDKYAIQCHKQNHKGKCFGSITDIEPNEIPDFDLFTGGFPCQAFSIAGKGQGVNDEKGRGLLFNEIIRICEVKQPKYILLENVKGLMSKRHSEFFEFTKSELKRIGYNIDVTLYNSKNYGIPQNRERVFYVCIRKDLEFNYIKPSPIENDKKMITLDEFGNKRPNVPEIGQAKRIYDKKGLFPSLNVGWSPLVLKDILEDTMPKEWEDRLNELNNLNRDLTELEIDEFEGLINEKNLRSVDKKYSLSEKCIAKLSKTGFRGLKEEIASTITTDIYKLGRGTNCIKQLNQPKHSNDRVYAAEGISPTLNTMQGGNRQPFIQIKNATKQGYLEAKQGDGISLEHPNSETRRGRVQEQLSPTLQCNDSKGVITDDLRIRKLTPKECFRLMGFLNDQINLEGISDSQRYRLAGNGWEINLVSLIMKGFLKQTKGSINTEQKKSPLLDKQ